jgi:glycosyltransferase involved in cell wall biosynthesis
MIIAFPHPPGEGGPGSFQRRFEKALKEKGHVVRYSITDRDNDAVLVVGGSRKIASLVRARLRDIPVIHRLDGIGWLHRKRAARRGFKNFVYGELNNFLTNFLHSLVASKIIYQSEFVKSWWRKKGWIAPKKPVVIHNSVCLDEFKPAIDAKDPIRLICLEGNLDYSPFATKLMNQIHEKLRGKINLVVFGDFFFEDQRQLLNPEIDYRGRVSTADLASTYQRSIYLSLDVNAACPNTVMEALACGAPVVGYDTGALGELVPSEAGVIVPYGGDPWKLDFPDVDGLAKAVLQVQADWDRYSIGARKVAEEKYGKNLMFQLYLNAIEDAIVESRKAKRKPKQCE